MDARFLHSRKELKSLASIRGASEGKITSYIRYVCAMILQKISEMLASGWTISLAMYMSTRISTLYLDIRILPFACGAIHNYHSLAIPGLAVILENRYF